MALQERCWGMVCAKGAGRWLALLTPYVGITHPRLLRTPAYDTVYALSIAEPPVHEQAGTHTVQKRQPLWK